MDQVYRGAELTIVASAGANAFHGLPGVNGLERTQQQRFRLSGTTTIVTQVFPHGSYKLFRSVWSTRGWTYQEGFLSRRRLIFASDEVSFLCNKMYCSESFRHPLEVS